jgi:hypothetical protein
MGDVVCAFLGGEVGERLSDGFDKGVKRWCGSLAKSRLAKAWSMGGARQGLREAKPSGVARRGLRSGR